MKFKIVSTHKAALKWVDLSEECESIILKNIELMKNNAT